MGYLPCAAVACYVLDVLANFFDDALGSAGNKTLASIDFRFNIDFFRNFRVSFDYRIENERSFDIHPSLKLMQM